MKLSTTWVLCQVRYLSMYAKLSSRNRCKKQINTLRSLIINFQFENFSGLHIIEIVYTQVL